MKVSLFSHILPDSIRIPLALWARKSGLSTHIQTALCMRERRSLSLKHALISLRDNSSSKVLIVCAHFNHAQYLRGCVESILAQTHSNFELVIVDDKSTDASVPPALRTIQSLDPRIKVIHLDENSGAYIARNTGISAATPDWTHVTFIDPDDIALPGWLTHTLHVLNSGCGTVRPVLERWTPDFKVFKSMYFGHCPSLHSRDAWIHAGGFLPVRVSGDAELTSRMGHLSRHGLVRVLKASETSQRVRLLPGSASHQKLADRKKWLEDRDREMASMSPADLKVVPVTASWK